MNNKVWTRGAVVLILIIDWVYLCTWGVGGGGVPFLVHKRSFSRGLYILHELFKVMICVDLFVCMFLLLSVLCKCTVLSSFVRSQISVMYYSHSILQEPSFVKV